MAKKKTNHLIGKDKIQYEDMPELEGVINKQNFEFINRISEQTLDLMKDEWAENIAFNKKYWKKHSPLKNCLGIAKNKAIIGVGAGASFNKNKDVLKYFVNKDGIRDSAGERGSAEHSMWWRAI